MLRINQLARGLLGFLGVPGAGDTPPFLANEFVRPTLDVFSFLGGDSLRIIHTEQFVNSATSPENGTMVIPVPADRTWLVRMISANMQLEPGDSATMRVSLGRIPLGGFVQSWVAALGTNVFRIAFGEPTTNSQALGGVHAIVSHQFTPPLLMLPGMTLSAGFYNATITQDTYLIGQLLVHELPMP